MIENMELYRRGKKEVTTGGHEVDMYDLVAEFMQEVTDADWRATMSTDLLLFDASARQLIAGYQAVNDSPSSTAIHDFMTGVQQRSGELLKELESEVSPITRWRTMREAYFYYAFGEVFTEASQFSNRVFTELEQIHGSQYLEIVEKLDAMQPSALTDISPSEDAEIMELGAWEKNYLELKYWQDSQHVVHENGLSSQLATERRAFDAWRTEHYPQLAGLNAREALAAVDIFYTKKPISVEDLAHFVSLVDFPKKLIIACFGGKNYGLAKLFAVQANIPETYAIPVGIMPEDLMSYLPDNRQLSNKLWAVRSSATVEDGEKTAFAGVFTSELRVSTDRLEEAYARVCDSVNAPRVRAYVETFKTEEPRMSVVVQCFREPEMAGVWMGRSEGADMEWVDGDGEKLVSGATTPMSLSIHHGEYSGVGTVQDSIVQSCLELQNTLGQSADLEWCIVDGELVFVQFRPVTEELHGKVENFKNTGIQGMGASAGIIEGIGYYVDDVENADGIGGGNILIADSTDPDFLGIMHISAGILTSEGGRLCHAAITARELHKPCIVGAGDSVRKLHGIKIRINGSTGQVEVLGDQHSKE